MESEIPSPVDDGGMEPLGVKGSVSVSVSPSARYRFSLIQLEPPLRPNMSSLSWEMLKPLGDRSSSSWLTDIRDRGVSLSLVMLRLCRGETRSKQGSAGDGWLPRGSRRVKMGKTVGLSIDGAVEERRAA